jgi:hypothetical protein
LSIGGFVLRKWGSNNIEVLEYIFPEERETVLLYALVEGFIKTLDIVWHPSSGKFQFQVDVKKITHKRSPNVVFCPS